jgi:DNA modification methylase
MRGAARTAELNDLDDVREPDDAEDPVARAGDMFECGRHRVFCGNSLDPEVITRLAGGVTFAQSLSDPPYDLPTRFFSSNRKFSDFQMAAGELGREKFTEFLSHYLKAVLPHLADGALIYAFMDHRHIAQLITAGEGLGLEYKQLLVWVKGSAGMGSFYRSGHELIAVFKHGTGPHRNNIELGVHGRNRSNVLSYPGVMTIRGRKKALAMHPSVKNVALLADLLLDASAPGDAVLDSFGGSGSTLIAAEKVGRTAYLCELSPKYVDVAVQRYNALGVGEARLAGTGQTFADLRVERLEEGRSSDD